VIKSYSRAHNYYVFVSLGGTLVKNIDIKGNNGVINIDKNKKPQKPIAVLRAIIAVSRQSAKYKTNNAPYNVNPLIF